jgi:hypothetical protein
MRVKGMVQVLGATYRVVRIGLGEYDVIRILDDTQVGRFRTLPVPTVTTTSLPEETMREVVRAAIHGAKTSWVGRLNLA